MNRRLTATLAALLAMGFLLFVLLCRPGILPVPILFYRGVAAAFLVAALQAALIALLPRLVPPPRAAYGLAAVSLTLAFNLSFLILFPVTVDRSISVFLLSELDSRGARGLSGAELEQVFVQDYVLGLEQIDRRMSEQIASGNIEPVGDRFRLTSQGRDFVAMSRAVAHLFGTDLQILGEAERD